MQTITATNTGGLIPLDMTDPSVRAYVSYCTVMDVEYENEYSYDDANSTDNDIDVNSMEIDYPEEDVYNDEHTSHEYLDYNEISTYWRAVNLNREFNSPTFYSSLNQHTHVLSSNNIAESKRICSVCCESKLLLLDHETNQIIQANRINQYRYHSKYFRYDRMRDNVLVNPNCSDSNHIVCVKCLRTYILNDPLSVFRQGNGRIPCPCGLCKNIFDRRCTINLNLIQYIWNTEEYVQLQRQASRFTCNTHDQDKSSCYNSYIWPADEKQGRDIFPRRVKHTEININALCNQFIYYMTCQKMHVKCKECGIFLSKSVACNALSHCGAEICYVCGKTATQLSANHWETCPRFDTDARWNNIGRCNFKCESHKCYTEHKECTRVNHIQGIKNMHNIRRHAHIYNLYLSLNSTYKKQVDEYIRTKHSDILDKFCFYISNKPSVCV